MLVRTPVRQGHAAERLLYGMDQVYYRLLAAIDARRLVIFSGAGLSMAEPSLLPSAREMAREAARRHAAKTGEILDESIREDIEAQARLFHASKRLQTYFLPNLIDWTGFAGEPNAGHYAVADLLLSHALAINVTTNVDVLVEKAAGALGYERLDIAISGSQAAVARPHPPFLKIHGCVREPADTLWCHEQLDEPPWHTRIAQSAQWLAGGLMQKDLIFVGFWSDWPYLNEILHAVLVDQTPRSVTLVDPADGAVLAAKAKELWDWAHRPDIEFEHVQMSGSDFLAELRLRYSRLLLQQIAARGAQVFEERTGAPPPAFPDMSMSSVDQLYDLRRDWSGVPRRTAVLRREPQSADELLGSLFYELVAAGAVLDGNLLELRGERVRLVQGAGRPLYRVQEELAEGLHPADTPQVTVCVAADDDGGAAGNVLRPARRPSIIRGNLGGKWYSHARARAHLGLD